MIETAGSPSVASGGGESAPPASSPAPSPADTRPASWAEAFGSEPAADSAPAAPSEPTPLVPTPEAATPPPSAPETVPSPETTSTTPAGPIPFERHKAALENARTKAAQATIQQVQEHYGAGIDFQSRFDRDPVGTAGTILEGLAQHPDYGPQIIALAARMLSARRGQAALDQEPGPDLQAGDGTPLYSAERQAQREAWLRRQIQQEWTQALTPLQQREAAREQAEQQAQALAHAKTAAHERMSKLYQDFAKQPHFLANKPEITKRFQAIREASPHLDLGAALGLAYAAVVDSVVVPAQVASQQQQVQASAVAKATGRSTPPGMVTPAPQGRPRTMREALAQVGGL